MHIVWGFNKVLRKVLLVEKIKKLLWFSASNINNIKWNFTFCRFFYNFN